MIEYPATQRCGSSSGGSDLTVVIPVWDTYVRWLARSVAMIRRQVPSARVVIIDNASAVPLPLLPFDVEVLRLPMRHSVGASRNLGLCAARTL